MKTKLKNIALALIDIRCFFNSKQKYRFKYKEQNKGDVYILTSGPSLSETFETLSEDFFVNKECCFVNDMAQLSFYTKIKPLYYVMADPCYWVDENKTNESDIIARTKTFEALISKTNWDMILFVHKDAFKSSSFLSNFSKNKKIRLIPITLYDLKTRLHSFQNFTYKFNYAAPSANVLCMTLFCCLNMGYKQIIVFGADHSWLPDIRINDKNQVCTIKRHVGEEDSALIPWAKSNRSIFTLPELLMSLFYTFDNYHRLKDYATHLNANIYNATPNSFIDAFERLKVDNKNFYEYL